MDGKSDATHQSRRGIIAGAGAAVAALVIGSAHAGGASESPSNNFGLPLNVRSAAFGARGDGTSDDTGAIQAALQSAGDAGGGIVFVPVGTYLVSSELSVPMGVLLLGASKSGATLETTSPTLSIITLGHASGVSTLNISTSVNRTAGTTISIEGNSAFVENCNLSHYFVGISVGTSGTLQSVGARMSNINFVEPSVHTGGGAIYCANFANVIIEECIVAGPATGAQPSYGVRVGGGDTGIISNTNITRHGRALYVDVPHDQNCFALQVSNSLFDSAGTTSDGHAASCAEFSPDGGVYDTKFANCWFGLSISGSGCSVNPTSTGIVDGLTFTGCEFVQNAATGLSCVGADVKNWVVSGGYSAGNPSYGIHVTSGGGAFTITGHRAGPAANRGPNGVGIGIDAGASDEYVIVGNNLRGNSITALVDGGAGVNKILASNLF